MFGIKRKNQIIEELKAQVTIRNQRILLQGEEITRLKNKAADFVSETHDLMQIKATGRDIRQDMLFMIELSNKRFKEVYTHLGVVWVDEATVPAHLAPQPKKTPRQN